MKAALITLSDNFETFIVVVLWDGTEEGKVETRRAAFAKAKRLGFNGAFVAYEQY